MKPLFETKVILNYFNANRLVLTNSGLFQTNFNMRIALAFVEAYTGFYALRSHQVGNARPELLEDVVVKAGQVQGLYF